MSFWKIALGGDLNVCIRAISLYLETIRFWFSVSNTFEMSITISPTLFTLFSIETHVSIIFRKVFWFYDFYGLLKILPVWTSWMNFLSKTHFFKHFWQIRKGTNMSLINFVCRIIFSKNWCNISIRQSIGEIPIFYTAIDNFSWELEILHEPVEHDFNWLVFESEGLIFRWLHNDFYNVT